MPLKNKNTSLNLIFFNIKKAKNFIFAINLWYPSKHRIRFLENVFLTRKEKKKKKVRSDKKMRLIYAPHFIFVFPLQISFPKKNLHYTTRHVYSFLPLDCHDSPSIETSEDQTVHNRLLSIKLYAIEAAYSSDFLFLQYIKPSLPRTCKPSLHSSFFTFASFLQFFILFLFLFFSICFQFQGVSASLVGFR